MQVAFALRRLRELTVAVGAALVLTAGACTPTAQQPSTAGPLPAAPDPSNLRPYGQASGWVLKFADEFNGTALDRNVWRANWHAPDDAAITKPVNSSEVTCYDPARVSVGGGVVTLSAVATTCTTFDGRVYPRASGIIESHKKFTFTHGYLEAHMWLDSAHNWPAFWATGLGPWPATGELDVVENLGGALCWHFHSAAGAPGGCATTPVAGWHTFGAAWEPGSVTYYYDGTKVGTITSGITSSPMYLVANLGLRAANVVPASAKVDWIRVWQRG